MKNNKNTATGFTLIELLIVLVILGISFSFAVLAFGDFGENKRIFFAAEQLATTLRLAQQQAILESSILGLRIDNTGYQILQLQPNDQWIPAAHQGIFKKTYFPKNTHITLKTNTHILIRNPSILITSSGDISPFTLSFGSSKEDNVALLTGQHNGTIQIK